MAICASALPVSFSFAPNVAKNSFFLLNLEPHGEIKLMFVMRKIEVQRYNERQRHPMLSGFLFPPWRNPPLRED